MDKQAQHTPGPWEVNGFTGMEIWDTKKEKTLIARAARIGVHNPEVQANARLIASAPELFAALKEIYEMTNGATGGMHSEIFDVARAAIAKVEGK